MKTLPKYLNLYKSGKLGEITENIFSRLSSCDICPRKCQVNRLKNERGFCKTGLRAKVYSVIAHHGEEPPVSGEFGSGTIFFSHCNMGCLYCQNYEFSQLGEGREVEIEELCSFMLQLQGMKCHNINFVTPTHVLPQILKALCLAISKGLEIPLVYNTSGYESPEIIRLLNGIVDIYLADLRYADDKQAIKYSCSPNYVLSSRESVKEMHRQVGLAKFDQNGIIQSGLIIRHLVLPDHIAGSDEVMAFIANVLSKETYISLMSQYFPCYKAEEIEGVSRRITFEEYEEAKKVMHKYGLYNGWLQEDGGLERFAGTNIKRSL